MKISLCLIVLNELKGCQIDVPKLPRDRFDEIFAIDGGSTDGTVEYLQEAGIVVHQQPKRGLNAAYVHANRVASTDAVIAFFPKGTLATQDLLQFAPLFAQGYDLVIASRNIAHAHNEEDGHWWRPRKWGVGALAAVSALLWRREGAWIRDVLHGFKGWKRAAFSRMDIVEQGLSIDLEMVIRCYRLRLKCCEFPTREGKRTYGESHFKVWPTGKKLASYLLFELRRPI